MKKVWFGIGIVIIVGLLLLTTRFSAFLQMEEDGHAVLTDSVVSMLMRDPLDEKITESVEMHDFESMQWIYSRGSEYYIGEKKKEQIDLNFPFYINDGAALLFTQSLGNLYNSEFEEEDVYNGLVINDGISYNPGGERADAGKFLFYQTSNGLFLNLVGITYYDSLEEREIKPNSIIYFTVDHMTYYEYVDGNLIYQCATRIQEDSRFCVDGEWMDYYDLLLKLHVIYEPGQKEETVSQAVIPEYPEESTPLVSANTTIEEESTTPEEEKEETPKEEKEHQNVAQLPQEEENDPYIPDVPRRPTNHRPPSRPSNALPLGVRPDSLRPDRQTVAEPVVQKLCETDSYNWNAGSKSLPHYHSGLCIRSLQKNSCRKKNPNRIL
ncbi:MAG TPA: hypothetical protein PLZ77_08630 [Lachnospiraceae bacterium]|nr:hypothetical protein [Lachnospiraceae bacterium]HPF30149.1 hypothetical protein [Lachnospiraceae bacterium]